MIDYYVDKETYRVIDGDSDHKQTFIEYWQFIHHEKGHWVLNEILQNSEYDRINFHDER